MFHRFDFDARMLRIGSMNLMLHRIEQPIIEARDSLAQDHAGVAERFTMILANPPFKGSVESSTIAENDIPHLLECWRGRDALRDEIRGNLDAIAIARPMPLVEAVQVLTALKIDVMLPQMFCVPGMTSYRALFDLLNIPYVGNKPDVMALTAHKARAKAVVAASGVKVPSGELLRLGDRPTLIPPTVVKPVSEDNSLGVALVKDASEYGSALKTAFTHADEVLVETFIELGREVRCGVIAGKGKLICLPLEEYAMDADKQPIRRHEDKLKRDEKGGLGMVAKGNAKSWIVDPNDPITTIVWEAARISHIALGCRHYSLFDFRIDSSNQPWFLEAGLYCSFAQTSVISEMSKEAGTTLGQLFHIMLNNALLDVKT